MQRQTASTTASTTAIDPADGHDPDTRDTDIEDTNFMDDWHSEWAIAPHYPLPSNLIHLNLLNKPARINLRLHAQQARTASLYHYDVDFVPDGRKQLEERWAHEQRERRLKQDAEAFVRGKVVKAASVADAIGLTQPEDDGEPTYLDLICSTTRHRNGQPSSQRRASRSSTYDPVRGTFTPQDGQP